MIRLLEKKRKSGDDSVNAIDFLKEQHREVEALFDEFEKLSDRAVKSRQSLFDEISHKLTCHARIEEKIFYPEGRPVDKDLTLEAYEEHDVIKSMLRKIAHTTPDDETFKAKMTVLKEVVKHHVEEEENTFFPEMEKQLGRDRLEELGMELQQSFERLDAGHPEPKVRHLKKA